MSVLLPVKAARCLMAAAADVGASLRVHEIRSWAFLTLRRALH